MISHRPWIAMMSIQKTIPVLISTLQCIIAGLISGLVITLLLCFAVLLFASYAKANAVFENDQLGDQYVAELQAQGGTKMASAMKETDEIRQSIIQTAIIHHLVSKYTSLIAVDVTPSRLRDEILKSKSIPVNLPAGWEYDKVFGRMPATATDSRLHFLIGIILILTGIFFGLTRKYVFNV